MLKMTKIIMVEEFFHCVVQSMASSFKNYPSVDYFQLSLDTADNSEFFISTYNSKWVKKMKN